MNSKIEHPSVSIDAENFTRGQTMATASIHLTGGIRALQANGGWSIGPVPSPTGPQAFRPFPLAEIERFARLAGILIAGYEQTSGMGGPLLSRIWTPRPTGNGFSAADKWASISTAAARSGDEATAAVARKIAVTLNAAGIRIRDASDCLNAQLHAAIINKQAPDRRFRNIPLHDLFLAFHSLMSEMASARDYLAQFAGQKLGAPQKVDALNRFDDWISAASRSGIAAHPLALAMAGSRDGGANAWLASLTDYRNLFLHKTPLGAMGQSASLIIVERKVEAVDMQFIEMQIPDLDVDGTSTDALTKFVTVYENLLKLADLAANHADYSHAPPSFVVGPSSNDIEELGTSDDQ